MVVWGLGMIAGLGICGPIKEDNSVVTHAASLRLDHPCEQRALAGGPVLRQQGRTFGKGYEPKAKALGYLILAAMRAKAVGFVADCSCS